MDKFAQFKMSQKKSNNSILANCTKISDDNIELKIIISFYFFLQAKEARNKLFKSHSTITCFSKFDVPDGNQQHERQHKNLDITT